MKIKSCRWHLWFVLLSCAFALVLSMSFTDLAQSDAFGIAELSQRWISFETPIDHEAIESNESSETLYPITVAATPEPELFKPVYLTFDDGPSEKWTPLILDLLQRYQAKGTFYMLGRNVATYPDIVLQLAQGNQSLANHSYNHPNFNDLSYEGISWEVGDTSAVQRRALADHPELSSQIVPCVRPPYGEANNATYNTLWGLGYSVSLWDLDTNDWRGLPPETILNHVLSMVETNRVILMHDGGEERQNTVDALHLILHELTLRGYRFEPYCTQNGQAVLNP